MLHAQVRTLCKVLLAPVLALCLSLNPWSLLPQQAGVAQAAEAVPADAEDYPLVVRPGDTLIAIGKRLLIDPNRWPDVQKRNKVPDPFRLVPGSTLYIPRALLRLDQTEIVVRSVTGPATRADGSPLAVGDRLTEGSGVKTAANGFVSIQLIDGSTMRLQPQSDMKVEKARRVGGSNVTETQVEMRSGQAEVQFKPAIPKVSRFEIRTGFASAAVRGTGFRVAVLPAGTRTEVVEGTIAFAGMPAGGGAPAAADTVAVAEGFGSYVDESRKPVPPVPLLRSPQLPRPQVVQIAPNLRLRFPRIAGAVSYRATLATDPQMQVIRYQAVSQQPEVNFSNLEPGVYMLAVRAIDQFGLEGRDDTVPVAIVQGKPAAVPPGQNQPGNPAASPAAPATPPASAVPDVPTPVKPAAPSAAAADADSGPAQHGIPPEWLLAPSTTG